MSPTSPPARILALVAPAAALLAICLGLIVVHARRASRQAAAELRASLAKQARVLRQADRRERERHAALGKGLAKISRAKHAASKPADLIRRLPAAFPPLPRPVSVSWAKTSAPSNPSAPPNPYAGAEPPAVITVPSADLKPLFDQLETCRACEETLAVANQDLADERTKVAALTTQRDAALQVARSGGFWTRLRTGAKWFAIGLAAGAIAASAAQH